MSGNSQPLFNETIRNSEKANSLAVSTLRRVIVRWAHVFGAIAAATVLVWQSKSFARPDLEPSAMALAGWGLLAVWPYGFSFLIASTTNTRTSISTLVQTMLLCLITALVCSAYAGQLFDASPHGWEIAAITVIQAFFLLVACGVGESAAEQAEFNNPQRPPAPSHKLLSTHLILALVAMGSWLMRSELWHKDYVTSHGFELASFFLLATLPYLAGAVLSWHLVTAKRRKRWAYVGILLVGTALAVANNSGIWVLQPGLLGVWLVLIIQFILFIFGAEWAVDELEG